MRSIFQEIADNAKDDGLFNEMNDIYSRYEMAEDNQLFEIADAIDVFWKEHCNDVRVKAVVDTLKKDSLCKSIEEAGVRIYNGAVRPDYTPDAISSLKADEVFVFGSNLHGGRGGGAARAAMKKFGAIWHRINFKIIMANHKSAIKRIRQTETRNLRNRYYAKTMRNAVRKLRVETDKVKAAEDYKKVSSMLDKLARKNVISKNKASNLKSKLALYVNKLGVA